MLESGRTLTGGRGEVWFEPGHRGRDMCGAEGGEGDLFCLSGVDISCRGRVGDNASVPA